MNKINTTEKGDLFEKKVFEIIKKLLDNEDFFVSGKRSKIYWKKSYVSKETNSNVIVDISIETFLPNADKYSQLTIIECKNYESAVPINDIREFGSILNEIGTHKTNGIMISKSRFQEGAYNFAVSTGIGLAILKDKSELDWINYRIDRKYNQYNIDDINSFLSNNSETDFFAYINKYCFENLPDLLLNIGIIDKFNNKQEFINIPYKTEEQIVAEISKLPSNIYIDNKLDTDILINFLAEKYNADFILDSSLNIYNHNKILGKIAFNPLKIYLTKELKEECFRWRFTLAHEIGHLILHSEVLKNYINNNIDNETTIFHNETSDRINNRMEIQANIFATRLLLPDIPFKILVQQYFIKERILKGHLYLDNQSCNRILVNNLLLEIKYSFGVSLEVGKIRLKNLNLLIDKTENSIESILRNC